MIIFGINFLNLTKGFPDILKLKTHKDSYKWMIKLNSEKFLSGIHQ